MYIIISGGGEYDKDGFKIGHWIDLSEVNV